MHAITGSRRLLSWKDSRLICRSMSTQLYVKGLGLFGALGVSEKLIPSKEFEQLDFDLEDDSMKMISAGWGHSSMLTDKGHLYIWGRPLEFSTLMRLNNIHTISSFLGRMIAYSSNMFFGNVKGYFPTPMLLEGQSGISMVSSSAGLTFYLTSDGKVWAFGQNRWKQCGIDTKRIQHVHQPTVVDVIPPCSKVEAGLQHGIALTQEGEIYLWGKTDKGRLGLPFEPKKDPSFLPILLPIEDPASGRRLKVKDIAAGFSHSVALTEDGAVYVWGKGMSLIEDEVKKSFARVYEAQLAPRRIELPDQRQAIQVYSSNFQIVILASDGSVWMMGTSDDDRNGYCEPVRVESDYHLPSPSTLQSKPTANYLHFSVGGDVLRKGFNKVAFITHRTVTSKPSQSAEVDESHGKTETQHQSFQFMLRGDRAFISPILSDDLRKIAVAANKDSLPHVIDYSVGWKHELLLVRWD